MIIISNPQNIVLEIIEAPILDSEDGCFWEVASAYQDCGNSEMPASLQDLIKPSVVLQSPEPKSKQDLTTTWYKLENMHMFAKMM